MFVLGPIATFLGAATSGNIYTHKFSYSGIPFVSYETTPKLVDADTDKIFGQKTGIYFSKRGSTFKPEEGHLEATCVRCFSSKSVMASITLTVEKRLRPDIAREICNLKDRLQLLKAGCLSRLKPDLVALKQEFDTDRVLLEVNKDLSLWSKNLVKFLENRVSEGEESIRQVRLAQQVLMARLALKYDEYKSLQVGFSVANLMLPLIGAEPDAAAFLSDCLQVDFMQEVGSILEPEAVVQAEPTARLQNSILTNRQADGLSDSGVASEHTSANAP